MAANVQWPGHCGPNGYDSRRDVTWLLQPCGPWQLADVACSLGAVLAGGRWLQPLCCGSWRTMSWPWRAGVVRVAECLRWPEAVCEAGRAVLLVSFVFVVSG